MAAFEKHTTQRRPWNIRKTINNNYMVATLLMFQEQIVMAWDTIPAIATFTNLKSVL